MKVDTVIKNCKIVRHNETLDSGLAVHRGVIKAIAPDHKLPPAESIIDGGGHHIIPGVVDAHVHLQYPPGVDPESNIRNETKACAVAGCTTMIHLLAPADDIKESAEEFIKFYEKNAYIDLALSARIYTLENIKQIKLLYDYGINNVKLLIPYKGTEAVWKGRTGGIDDGIIYFTFKEVGRLAKQGCNVFARVHCENVEIFLQMKNEFLKIKKEPSSWNEVRNRVCEAESLQKCLYLAGLTECPLYVVHLTIKEGIDLLKAARAKGVNVVAETCVQYLTQNVDNTDAVLSKVNPPIRELEDNEKLWEALRNNDISIVATDHAPVPMAMKKNIWDATVGMPGAETFLPLMLSEGVNKKKISLEKLVDACCFRPAETFGLTPRKGMLEIGSDADLVLIDLKKEKSVPKNPKYSGSDFSTVAGKNVTGWPILTMLGGRIVAKDGEIVDGKGLGRFIPCR